MERTDIPALIDRIARLATADAWEDGLNPAQRAALDYLSRANRFSRSPSHLADYFGTTRGTMSQTLKSLGAKGLVEESRSFADRRSVSHALTKAGAAIVARASPLDTALTDLPPKAREELERHLASLARSMLTDRGGKAFGLCAKCRFNQVHEDGIWCDLLKVPLSDAESQQICHEFEETAA